MKMKKVICLLISFCLVLILFSTLCIAQELTVEEMIFCTAIEERQPAGVDTTFSNTVERVYCFSKIAGATDTVTVFHVWYHNDQEMAKIELTVKGKSWRTWSSKRIMQEWQGKWKVDIVTSNGDILKSKEFTIKP
jgi:hypothetical protein